MTIFRALIGLAALAAAVRPGLGETASSQTPTVPPTTNDVIIVGAGISGLAAALELGRGGASITVIDLASVFGGHAVMSSGMVCFVDTPEQRAAGVVDSPDLAFRDFISWGEDANRGWARAYAQTSGREIYDWLHGAGVTRWELFPEVIPGNSVRRQHVANGRGVGLVTPLYRECLRLPNLSFRWNTKVTDLLIGSGRTTGVRGIHLRTGQTNEFRAAYIILGTGGFESNLSLVRAYWPDYLPRWTGNTRVLLGSGINARGSGLSLAQDAGAALDKLDHQLFYSTGLVDPRDASGQRGVHAFNTAAIWVNQEGKRFVLDGPPDPKNQVPAVLGQNPPAHWQIFDATARPRFFVSGSDFNDPRVVEREIFSNPRLEPWVKRSDSIVGLARSAGLPQDALAATVKRWNEMVDRGEDSDYHRFGPSSPIRPAKIVTPPFFAVQLFPLARKSLGGVAVDLSCRVIDRQSHFIPGLYAVGELAGVGGINGKAALEGTMLGPGILMGRTGAKDILSRLGSALRPPRPDMASEPAPSPKSRTTDPNDLRSWQEVLRQLVEKPRPGFWHFEKAHAVVLTRNYDCSKCHLEPSPLTLTEDQLDRRALLGACPICHGGVKD